MYDDEYATCRVTYATLRVYGLRPEDVTRGLGLSPTESAHRGELRHGAPVRHDAWLLNSRLAVDSKDARRHLDWIFDQLAARRGALRDLVSRGASVDVSCYWLSAAGHGGPTISTEQARRLAELEIDLSFDVYFAEETT
jgi:hypothetical protein